MKLSLIYKGILLWFTLLSILIFLSGGAESLIDNGKGYFALLWLSCNILLAGLCSIVISHKEMAIVSGKNFFDKLLEKL